MKKLIPVVLIVTMGGVASAGTINAIANSATKSSSNNGGGSYETTFNSRTSGTDHLVPSFVKTYSWTDGGVSFDYDLTLTAFGGDGQLQNFNGPTYSYGVTGGNGAIDQVGEKISFSVGNIHNVVGATAGDITFDGFTGLGIFFAQGEDDAGAITDGTSDIWMFDGALGTAPASNGDPAGTKVTGNSSDDSMYSWFGIKSLTHAQVTFNPVQSLEYEYRTATVAGQNRNRVNNVGVQFTVIPEPATVGLITAFGGALLFIRRRFQI